MTDVFDIADSKQWKLIKDYYDDNGYVIIESGLDGDGVKSLASDLNQWFTEDSFPSEDCAMRNENRIQDA